MKKTLFTAIALFGLTSVNLASASDSVLISGSPEAAKEVGCTFVALIYGANRTSVEVSQPTIANEWASLQTKSDGKVCNLTLQKNTSANKYGWVVNAQDCH